MDRTHAALEVRLLRRTLKVPDGCWLWQGSVNAKGYGTIGAEPNQPKNTLLTHRVAAYLWLGMGLGERVMVCHHCDVPNCINPVHLYLDNGSKNQKDAYARGLQPSRRGEANGRAKLSRKKVEKIRQMYSTGKYTQTQLAKASGVTQVQISGIVRRKSWT